VLHDAARGDALLHELVLDRGDALLGDLLVLRGVAARVGRPTSMTFQLPFFRMLTALSTDASSLDLTSELPLSKLTGSMTGPALNSPAGAFWPAGGLWAAGCSGSFFLQPVNASAEMRDS